MLKWADQDGMSLAELEWQADLFASLCCDGFRVSRARRTGDGALVVEGWCAWERLDGRHEERRWGDAIAVGERFHAAIAHVPRPTFLDARTDQWAIGDRVAWGELPVEDWLHIKHLPRLAALLRAVEAPSAGEVVRLEDVETVPLDERGTLGWKPVRALLEVT